MTPWSMGVSIPDLKPGMWYSGYVLDQKMLARKSHTHMVPLAFCALAVMQRNRYYSLAIKGREHDLSAAE
jgi:hypothetical protein